LGLPVVTVGGVRSGFHRLLLVQHGDVMSKDAEPISDLTTQKRWQFSLRASLVVMTLTCVALAVVLEIGWVLVVFIIPLIFLALMVGLVFGLVWLSCGLAWLCRYVVEVVLPPIPSDEIEADD
jgi:hypothetical protein